MIGDQALWIVDSHHSLGRTERSAAERTQGPLHRFVGWVSPSNLKSCARSGKRQAYLSELSELPQSKRYCITTHINLHQ
jgi:hypothetical protein